MGIEKCEFFLRLGWESFYYTAAECFFMAIHIYCKLKDR